MTERFDAVVVGAGPYGLSVAAHLRGRGLRVAVFGRVMGMWREHMPKGMLLRSHWWATNLSDPRGTWSFANFSAATGRSKDYPVPIQTFIDYGRWFQQHAVPDVDETLVASIARDSRGFLVTLTDGRRVESGSVVMAIGLQHFANRPKPFTDLPTEFVSHASDHADFGAFKGRRVVVVGACQSAIESAALLVEAGARVDVLARRPIMWLPPARIAPSLIERIRAPDASVAPGWQNWVFDHLPYLFFRYSQRTKDTINSWYVAGATDWLRERIIGKASLHEGHTATRLTVAGTQVDVTISDGTTVRADHVLLGTGYRVDLERLEMIDPSLRAQIRADGGIPILDRWFGASVPGLYFAGFVSLRAFGPVFRFVAGAGAAARRIAGAVAKARRAA